MGKVTKTLGSAYSGDFKGASGGFGDILGDITGTNRAAEAAQRAAEAQLAMATRTREEVLSEGRKLQSDAMEYAAATPQELSILSNALSSQQLQLGREERLLNAIDPALMEASQQALKLLRGETADINKPMQDLRASQRQKLMDSLRAQYGPGAESSSIGQNALRSFDMETNSMFAQNQQSALGQVFGIASSDLGGRSQRALAGLQQIGQGYSALNERRLNTRLNVGNSMLGALSGTSQQMIQNAGAPYVGDALKAQAQAQFINDRIKAGESMVGNAMGQAAGGAAMASDIRLKEDIKPHDIQIFKTVPTYSYRYKDTKKFGEGRFIGVMAQDLLALNPEHPAVRVGDDGFYRVNYAEVL